jgi:hypothetical protein
MQNLLYRTPCALAVAISVSKLILDVLAIPVSGNVMTAAVVACMFLLFYRTLAELALIAMLTLFVQLNAEVIENSVANPDWLLAVLISIIMLPAAMQVMGLEDGLHRYS